MDNRKRRDSGLAYIADDSVMAEMKRCRRLVQALNTADQTESDKISEIVQALFGRSDGAFVNPPFYCDYGSHIETGRNFYANYNCTILDVAKVTFGDNCLLGPNTSIYTAGHPLHPDSRNSGYEYGKKVSIGDNVWIGGSTVICPGVRIGDNSVIGAGSVVTGDIPSWSVAAGNPCRVIRRITEDDRKKLFRDEEFDREAWTDIMKRGFGGCI